MHYQDDLKAEAERLGFSLFGITTLAPPPHLVTYQTWIAAERHAAMDYLASERALQRRADPALLQPGANRLLVGAMRYSAPGSLPERKGSAPHGRVAAYAWGIDYHEIIPVRLNQLAAWLEQATGLPVGPRSYTDTGPILERDLAQRAGLGWAGKNTCLIDPRSGSYYLIGETFVQADLEPDPPFQTDHCGSCRRCIEACPTAAIREDRTIESGRCISYLTIENKASIPADLRSATGDWVFGCDICQMVCPWNLRFASAEGHPALEPQPHIAHPNLVEELALTPEEFRHKFRRSPILRAKRRGYLRNVAVALGNQPHSATLPALRNSLKTEPEPLVRGHAAWAIGQWNTTAARAALSDALAGETDPTVRAEILAALDGKSHTHED